MYKPQPWSPADATQYINNLGKSLDLSLTFTQHAEDRLQERGLTIGDALHVLKKGFVFDPCEPSTRPNFYKYKILSSTPNSNNRTVALVVISDPQSTQIKIVTAMWRDEK